MCLLREPAKFLFEEKRVRRGSLSCSIGEERVIGAAAAEGLVLAPWPLEVKAAAAALGISDRSPLRLLLFSREHEAGKA